MSTAAPTLAAPAARGEAGRFARFCAVGLVNTLITLAAFAGLSHLGIASATASALAFCVGAVNSFVLNRRWTFSDLPVGGRVLVRFVAVQLLGALMSAGGIAAVVSAGLPHFAAECAILPCVTATLYCLARLLVFRPVAPA